MRKEINGILLLDKPIEVTSNTALQKIKRLYQAKKAGHTGSLDPIATGMLPICFGEATKFSQFLLESDKTYHVVAKLGEKTSTGDREGSVIQTNSIDHITIEQLERVLTEFIGETQQIPPMFSALKHQGTPLYELARQGIEIDRPARKINIYAIKLLALDLDNAAFTFAVHCSKGTYVRTLVEDIAKKLDSCAHVFELRRLSVSPYTANIMYDLSTLENIATTSGEAGLLACLLPVETAVQIFPEVKLSSSAAFYMRTGHPVRATLPLNTSLVRLVSEDAKFLGIGEVQADGRVKPKRLVSHF